MFTEITARTATHLPRGWIFYDSRCALCTATAHRFERTLARRGFRVVPSGLWPELRLLTADGHTLGGADAVLFVARRIWWAWPLWALAQLPGMHSISHRTYRWIASHRYCIGGTCSVPASRTRSELHKEAR